MLITDPVRMRRILDSLTCSLCKKVFMKATTINLCMHTFCKKCITKKFEEDGVNSCPVCNQDLGTNPAAYLRPDENIRNIVKKITIGRKKKNEENSNGDGSNENGEEETATENARSPSSSLESTNILPTALNTMADFEHETPKTSHVLEMVLEPVAEDGQFLMASTRKKRNTSRKARQYNIVEAKGKLKVESSNANDYALPKNMAPLWFTLVPTEDTNQNGFPKLDKPSLRVKDYNATVSTFQKYIKGKLNLGDEAEVEISCRGKMLNPTMNLHDIKKLWIEDVAPGDCKKMKAAWKVEELCIELAYGPRKV